MDVILSSLSLMAASLSGKGNSHTIMQAVIAAIIAVLLSEDWHLRRAKRWFLSAEDSSIDEPCG